MPAPQYTTQPPENGRGCGDREQDALYLASGLAPFGTPAYAHVIDPAIPWTAGFFRGPMLRQRRDGLYDVVKWFSAEAWPFLCDKVEEDSRYGASVHVGKGFDVSKITPGESRLLYVGARTIPNFPYWTTTDTAPVAQWCQHKGEDHECTFKAWSLSALDSMNNHVVVKGATHSVVMCPSFQYTVHNPETPTAPQGDYYRAGIYFWVPITHFEYVNKNGKAPADLVERCETSGVPLAVMPK